jgi:hypothetical protein
MKVVFPIFWLKLFVVFSIFRFPFYRKNQRTAFSQAVRCAVPQEDKKSECPIGEGIIFPNRPGVSVSVWAWAALFPRLVLSAE